MSGYIDNLSLFPLNVFLLPGEETQLYIFEERYKQLIQDCESDQRSVFGIVYNQDKSQKSYGSLVELKNVLNRYPSGEMDIVVKAVGVFRLQKFSFQKMGKLYPAGQIEIMENLSNHLVGEKLMNIYRAYMLEISDYEPTWPLTDSVGLLDIAVELGLNDDEKVELVGLSSNPQRENYLINYFRYLKLLEEQEGSVQNGLYLN